MIVIPPKDLDENARLKHYKLEQILTVNSKLLAKHSELRNSLSVRAKTILRQHELWELVDLLPWIEGQYEDFMIYRNCGKKTSNEIITMIDKLRLYIEHYLDNSEFAEMDEESSIVDQENVQEIFEALLRTVSVRTYHVLGKANLLDSGSFWKYINSSSIDLLKLQGCGAKSAAEIQSLAKTFGDVINNLLDQQEKIATSDLEPSIISHITCTGDDEEFMINYKTNYGHLPMFFLLQLYFICPKNQSEKIFSELCGFSNDQFVSINELANHWGYSDQAIIQKIAYVTEHPAKSLKILLGMQDWEYYDFLKIPYLINYSFQEIACRERLANTFCVQMLLKLLGKTIYFYDNDKLSISNYADQSKAITTIILDEKYKCLNLKGVIREIKRLSNLKSDHDLCIPLLSYFINNEDYWTSTVSFDNMLNADKQNMLSLIEDLLKDTGLISGHNLIIKAKRHNYKDTLYCILKEKGERLHIEDLFHEFVTSFNSAGISMPFTDSSQIKRFLFADDRIVSIGKSSYWGLKEWGEVSGSVKSVVVQIISQSESPMKIDDLAQKTLQIRPDSSIKSITSVIYQCTYSGELDLYFDNYVAVSGKSSNFSGFVLFPRSFDDWISVFRQFVLEKQRFPYSNQNGYEGHLYRWYYNAQKLIDLEAEEILKFESLMDELSAFPHNSKEKVFLDNCNLYQLFVESNRRMVEQEDDKSLYVWFCKSKRDFDKLDGNLESYFSQLLKVIIVVLTDKLNQI